MTDLKCLLGCDRYPRWQVCDACRSRLRRWLAEIPDLCADLAADDPAGSNFALDHRADPDHNPVDHPYERTDPDTGRVWRHVLDPLGVLPPGPLRGAHAGGKVSGSAHPSAPANLAALDLLAAARHGSRAPHARGVLGMDEEQIGDLSVATVLDTWVRDWREVRGRGEGLPEPTVAALCRWLADRCEWACDEHPAVDEFAAELRDVRSALYARLGLYDVPDYKRGVPCRGCGHLTLVRKSGSDWVECETDGCGELYSPQEYADWAGLEAAGMRREHKEEIKLMQEIIEFVRARLAEDEAHAEKDLWAAQRASAGGQWEAHYGYNLPFSELHAGGQKVGSLSATRAGLADGEEDQHAADALFVARMTKKAVARAEQVLRTVAAHRLILDMYEAMQAGAEAAKGTVLAGAAKVRLGAYERALRALAGIWAGHDDHQAEWALDGSGAA